MRHFSRRLISQSLSWHSKSTPITHNPALQGPRLKCPENHLKSAKFTTAAQELSPPPVPTEKVSILVDELSELTLMDIMDLNEVLRDKFGIQSMPAMAVMMPGMKIGAPGGAQGGAAAAAAAKAEEKAEKTAFDLKLEGGFDAGVKLKIIKEVRACTSLGLKEAKELVEKAPTLLKKGVTKEEAEKIVEKMKEAGAKVIME